MITIPVVLTPANKVLVHPADPNITAPSSLDFLNPKGVNSVVYVQLNNSLGSLLTVNKKDSFFSDPTVSGSNATIAKAFDHIRSLQKKWKKTNGNYVVCSLHDDSSYVNFFNDKDGNIRIVEKVAADGSWSFSRWDMKSSPVVLHTDANAEDLFEEATSAWR